MHPAQYEHVSAVQLGLDIASVNN